MNNSKYDFAILGAGPGGYVAAIRAAQLGAKVALIEKENLGGVCLNKGCIPTKAIISSLNIFEKIKKAETFGIDINGTSSPNLKKIIERKNKIVSNSIKGIESLLKSHKIDLFKGQGKLVSKNNLIIVEGQDTRYEIRDTKHIIIATGSTPKIIPECPIDGKHIISSDEALNETTIPEHILIIGAGIIGCELAFIYKSLGAEVSLVEALPTALNTLDEDAIKIIEKEFIKKKINLYTNTKLRNTFPDGNKIKAILDSGQELIADKILISVGRKLNTENIGLEKIKINIEPTGQIIVNEYLETNVPNIYAIGDVIGNAIGGKMLAHKASYDGILVVENIINETKIKADYSYLPSVIFAQPEIGSFGLTEKEAKENNFIYKTGNFPFRASGKAIVMSETNGFVKIIVLKNNNKIIGATIVGPGATKLIHELALTAQNNLPIESIINTIHGHPTLSESIKESAEDVFGKAIHTVRAYRVEDR